MAKLSISIDRTYSHTEDPARRRRGLGSARKRASLPVPAAPARGGRVRSWLWDSISILVILGSSVAIYALH